MTLGGAAAAQLRFIVWCKDCRHRVEPDPAEQTLRDGARTAVLDWRARLVCSRPYWSGGCRSGIPGRSSRLALQHWQEHRRCTGRNSTNSGGGNPPSRMGWSSVSERPSRPIISAIWSARFPVQDLSLQIPGVSGLLYTPGFVNPTILADPALLWFLGRLRRQRRARCRRACRLGRPLTRTPSKSTNSAPPGC